MPNDPNDTMSVFYPSAGKEDRIPDTKDLSRPWCPLCEPIETLDLTKDFVRAQYCGNNGHSGLPDGDADATAYPEGAPYIGGTSESEGAVNRRLADLLRGEINETETPDLQTPGES
jgi:hypothetical protein